MIQPTCDMIPRALLVLFIIHIITFIIDVIRINTTYRYMNRVYYWMDESAISTLFYIDIMLCVVVCGVLAVKYILTGEIIWMN